MKASYKTIVEKATDVNATGLRVPPEVVASLGSHKKPPVKVSVGATTYRSTVAAYGNEFWIPLSAENRNAAGVSAGDEVEVTLELDQEPRTVTVPEDLAAALAEKSGATDAFAALSYSARKEYVRQVETAKALETRQRRISGIVTKLGS